LLLLLLIKQLQINALQFEKNDYEHVIKLQLQACEMVIAISEI
jgi:hypothetical protein